MTSTALQTPTNSQSELELDTLRNIQPLELTVEQTCRAQKSGELFVKNMLILQHHFAVLELATYDYN